jgi:hypothetical protein
MRIEGPNGEKPEDMPVLDFKVPQGESPNVPSVELPPRPSLDVAIESHQRHTEHLEPFITRLRTWDTSKLLPDRRESICASISGVEKAMAVLGADLAYLRSIGFVARTTVYTRMASGLKPGDRVTLRADQNAEFRQLYSQEQLDSLEVSRVGQKAAELRSGDGSILGMVKLIHIVPVGATP